jgi:hypothetical protein
MTIPILPPPAKSRRRLILATVIIVVIVAVSTITFLYLFWNRVRNPWLVVGSYCVYTGSTSALLPINMTLTLQIIDRNDSYVEVYQLLNVTTRSGTPIETNDTTQWIPVDKPMWLFTTANPTQAYECTVYIHSLKKFGVCNELHYVNGENRLTLFIDKQTQWIDEISMASPSSIYYNGVLTLEMQETNISGY